MPLIVAVSVVVSNANRRPRYMQNIPNAITNGDRASFIVDKFMGALGPSDFLSDDHIL